MGNSKRQFVIATTLAILVLCCSPGMAQWVQVPGPGGGDGHAFLKSGSELFAGVSLGTLPGNGLFKSSDTGRTWSPAGLTGLKVDLLAGHGSLMFAGISSPQYGVVDPDLLRSSDGGSTWQSVFAGLPTFNLAAITPVNQYLYVGLDGGGIYWSSDDGTTWNPRNNGLTNLHITSLLSDGTYLYAGTGAGVFRSHDLGNSWLPFSSGLENLEVLCLLRHPLYPRIIAGTSSGGYSSDDNGESWQTYSCGGNSLCSGQGLIFAGTSSGVYNAENPTEHWFPYENVSKVAFVDGCLFASVSGRIERSCDSGRTWENVSLGLIPQMVSALAIINGNMVAGNFSGLYHSSDGGNTWSDRTINPLRPSVRYLVAGGSRIYAGLEKLTVSDDGGLTWQERSLNGVSIAATDTDVVVASSVNDVCHARHSNDGFATWRDTCLCDCYGYCVCGSIVLARFDDVILAGSSAGFYRSANDGLTWTRLQSGSAAKISDFAQVGTTLFAAMQTDHFFLGKSTDRGLTWHEIAAPVVWTQVLASDGARLFAGTLLNGVYVSSDMGSSWEHLTDGLGEHQVYTLEVYHDSVYAGTSVGLFKRATSDFCCSGTTGNVNTTGIVDLADLSMLIAYLVNTPKLDLPCPAEANINGSGIVDLSDLSLLIAYLTASSRPALPNCF